MAQRDGRKPFRLAHLSDLHLEDKGELYEQAVALVEDAIEWGADHIVITGDLVENANMDLARAFVRDLRNLGLKDGRRLTIIVGNHDVFPVSMDGLLPKIKLSKPTANYQAFCKLTRAYCSDRLLGREPYPFGRKIGSGIVLAGLDTTPNGRFGPWYWAEGEMPEEDLDAVKDFFVRNSNATHKIICMHHHPYKSGTVDPFGAISMDFTSPDPATVRNWLAWSGASLVLCGHVHRHRDNTLSNGTRILATPAYDDEYLRFKLSVNGSVNVKRVRV